MMVAVPMTLLSKITLGFPETTKLKNKNEVLKISNSKQVDIKINAENKLKEKDLIISALKKEIKSLTPNKKKKGE